MGCGISTMDSNNASKVGCRFNGRLRHQHAAVPRPIVDNNKKYNNNNYRDDFIGPGSPSFREYCTDYDSVDRSSMVDSNDYTESGESMKNSSSEYGFCHVFFLIIFSSTV